MCFNCACVFRLIGIFHFMLYILQACFNDLVVCNPGDATMGGKQPKYVLNK